MKIKVLIYAVTTLLSVFALTGINFNKFWKKEKVIEARLFVMLLSFMMSYLITNFIVDFLSLSQIV